MNKSFFKKEFAAFFVLLGLTAGGLWAQDAATPEDTSADTSAKTQSNKSALFLGVDAMPLFKGLAASDSDAKTSLFGAGAALEWGKGKYSLGVRADLGFGKVMDADATYISPAALCRIYPMAVMEKLYLGAEIGISYEKVGDADAVMGLTAALRAGWRQKLEMFIIEPSISYGYAKTGMTTWTANGWQTGLSLGFSL